ncbi:heparinase II/III family protein [Thalassospiraceae bacterium LMO-JJ14]|nr:heparinase II/III family protein [Thalassospiraceae bacterium LMO-JJ14]
MFDVMPERLRTLIFGSAIYDWLLPSRAPSSIRAPKGLHGLGAKSAWPADMLAAPKQSAAHAPVMDDNFRGLDAAQANPADIWPAIDAWIARHRRWSPDAWRADILAERLTRWLTVYDAISIGIDPADRAAWATEILRSALHLNRVRNIDTAPWRRFLVHQARINAAIALPELEGTLAKRLSELGQDVERQIAGDGGHIERAPARALAVLAILTEIRDALSGHHIEPPTGLISALDRMVPFIKALQHADGGFALIAGATADTGALIDAVIAASGSKGRAMASAPHTGFHRLRAGQTTLICDCGRTLSADAPFHAPASFELSAGKVRLIGNCGMRLAADAQRAGWLEALSSTAAHSALIVGARDAGAVTQADVQRRDHEGARLIEMTHDGYLRPAGLMHTRSIYLDASGSDIRGEDKLSGAGSQPFSVRFHLYPDISASMVAGGGEVIVKPPRGRGWRFTCHYPVRLEDSVSFFDGRQHRAQQIVILGNHEPAETVVKWRLAIDS